MALLQLIQNTSYITTHKTPNWSMNAIDLIDPQYNPQSLEIADAQWSLHQLITFSVGKDVYYAIFYIEKDGYFPKDINAYHYNYVDGCDTFVTNDKADAIVKLRALKKEDSKNVLHSKRSS